MSRKKYSHNENTLGGRIRLFRKTNNYTITNFSKLLDISQGSLSDIENNKTKPSANPVENLVHKTDINIYWLFTGEGEMIRGDEKGSVNNELNLDEDPEIVGLLSKTEEILKSGTEYSASLAANIRSFHHSVDLENRLNRIESKIGVIESDKNDRRKSDRRKQDVSYDGDDRRSGERRQKIAEGE